jgi:hypothetical protein
MFSTAEYFNTTFHLFFRVAVVGQKFESISNDVEHWYGTKYRLEKIPDSVLDVSFFTVIFCRTYIYWPLSVFLISDNVIYCRVQILVIRLCIVFLFNPLVMNNSYAGGRIQFPIYATCAAVIPPFSPFLCPFFGGGGLERPWVKVSLTELNPVT